MRPHSSSLRMRNERTTCNDPRESLACETICRDPAACSVLLLPVHRFLVLVLLVLPTNMLLATRVCVNAFVSVSTHPFMNHVYVNVVV